MEFDAVAEVVNLPEAGLLVITALVPRDKAAPEQGQIRPTPAAMRQRRETLII